MKHFVKNGTLILGAGLFVFSLTACSGIQNHALAVAEKTEHAANFPSEYSITYEVQEPETNTIAQITKTCDADGNIYYSDEDQTILFLKDGDHFSMYEKNEEGDFTETTGNTLYTEDYVASATAEFTELAEQSKMQYTPGFEETGESSVADRTCRVFENKIGIAGMNTTYVLQVDEETGICLGYQILAETGIFDAETDKTTFSCTNFTDEDVTLAVPEELLAD